MSNGTCTTDGCDRPVHIKLHGLCRSHYNKLLRSRAKPCSAEGCERRAMAKGLCSNHYAQQRAKTMPPCEAEGCMSPAFSKRLCKVHYAATRYVPSDVPDWRETPGITEKNGEYYKACGTCGEPMQVSGANYFALRFCAPCKTARMRRYQAEYRKRPERRDMARVRRRDRDHRRRAVVVEAADIAPATVRMLALANYCQACGMALTDADGPAQKNVDHIVPLAVGGAHASINLRVICRSCNLSRPWDGSDLPPETASETPVL